MRLKSEEFKRDCHASLISRIFYSVYAADLLVLVLFNIHRKKKEKQNALDTISA
jgi:hypothetical protein